MHDTISERLRGPYDYKDPVFEQIRKVRSKISELRRHLSQVCTAGDRATINRKLSTKVPCEVTQEVLEHTTPKKSPEIERHFIKSEGNSYYFFFRASNLLSYMIMQEPSICQLALVQ